MASLTLAGRIDELTGVPCGVGSVHAYAVSQQPPPPGANPAAVTDAQLTTAVQAVHV